MSARNTLQKLASVFKGKAFRSLPGKGGKGIFALLNRYFKGERVNFSSLPLDLSRLPPFTQKVLKEVRKIPYGKVVSYGEIARIIGSRKKARGVGVALKKNPFPIIIPCHRVIRENGEIGGFSLGVGCKRWLLEREGIKLVGKRVSGWRR